VFKACNSAAATVVQQQWQLPLHASVNSYEQPNRHPHHRPSPIPTHISKTEKGRAKPVASIPQKYSGREGHAKGSLLLTLAGNSLEGLKCFFELHVVWAIDRIRT